ncbi:lumazine-binding protein [Mycolicibacterium austroafricanum]|uniref:Rv0361 family membrane protein n=1 Tax=Mycolicibacterium austroafricanum TaxID=39687 RepID=UPI001CA32D9F|nr:lumazine-binding protein [Mycolicibacterium austroafricanum]QZT60616.1 lumazine-binding protein [Mycolicibacterium austroafricanum]
MTEPDETSSGRAVAPFLGALSIIVAVVIGIWLFNLFSGDGLTDEQLIARATSGQNDALQRADYADLQAFTCTEARADEAEVLDRQRDSVEKRGNRFVERVAGVVIDGDRASADVTYYFEKDPDAKETVEMTFAREGGTWKVCSTGPS